MQWNQKQSNGGTVDTGKYGTSYRDWLQEDDVIKDLVFSPMTIDVAELEKLLLRIVRIIAAMQTTLHQEDVFDDYVPDRPIKRFKVNARVGKVKYDKVSRPIDDDFDSLGDE